MNPLLLGAALLLGPKLVGTAIAAKKLQFKPIGAKVIDGKLNIILSVTNPAATTVKVDALFLTCFLQLGTKKSSIGTITITAGKGFSITKQGVTVVYLPISLSGLGLVAIAAQIALNLSAIKAGTMKASVIVAGTVLSNGFTSQINETVPLDVSTITGNSG